MTATEQWIFLCAAHKTPKEVWMYFGKLTPVMQGLSFTVYMFMGRLLELASYSNEILMWVKNITWATLLCPSVVFYRGTGWGKGNCFFTSVLAALHIPLFSLWVCVEPAWNSMEKALCLIDRRVHAANRLSSSNSGLDPQCKPDAPNMTACAHS